MFMRVALVVLAIGAAVVSAKAVASLDAARRPAVDRPLAATARIARADDGHYWATGEVGGHKVRFLVDTGATAVSLTAADAWRVGIEISDRDYTHEITTARGPAKAAKVTLNSLTVDGVRVEKVEAVVIRDGLDVSLLGMSYLGRLSRFEASPTALVLRP